MAELPDGRNVHVWIMARRRIICQLETTIVKVTWKKYTSFGFELSKTWGLFVIVAIIPLMNMVIHSFESSFNFFHRQNHCLFWNCGYALCTLSKLDTFILKSIPLLSLKRKEEIKFMSIVHLLCVSLCAGPNQSSLKLRHVVCEVRLPRLKAQLCHYWPWNIREVLNLSKLLFLITWETRKLIELIS